MPPELVIRPLAPQDAGRVQEFVRALSPRSRRERYFSPIRELTPRQLERTMRPQEAGDLSLAAFDGAALVALAECARGEVAVVVADAWQGAGVGRELMQRLLEHARRTSLPMLHGLVRGGNRAMLRLAASLGFRAARDADPDLVQVELELADA
jgi:acetyltransferase